MRAYVYGIYNAESQVGEYIPHGVLSNTSCDDMPMSDLLGYVGAVGGLLNEIVLVLLLAIYILLERPEGSTFDVQNRIGLELENMVKVYISLKTLLSMATGVLTSIILLICNVKLALIFGLLAFLLNYIPSVGSMIACVLPGPIIFLDKEMSTGKKLIAFLGPASAALHRQCSGADDVWRRLELDIHVGADGACVLRLPLGPLRSCALRASARRDQDCLLQHGPPSVPAHSEPHSRGRGPRLDQQS